MISAKKITPEELAEIIANSTVIELNETMKILEEKYGITVQAPVAVATATVGPAQTEAGAGPTAEEKSVFTVVLTAVGDKKIEVIKIVRDATAKGLKEAKDLVDAAASAPQIIKENVKKEEAEELKKKFEEIGAKVELK